MFADIKIDRIAGIIRTGIIRTGIIRSDITGVIHTGLIDIIRTVITEVIRTGLIDMIRSDFTGIRFCHPSPRVFLCQRRNREKGDQHEQAEK